MSCTLDSRSTFHQLAQQFYSTKQPHSKGKMWKNGNNWELRQGWWCWSGQTRVRGSVKTEATTPDACAGDISIPPGHTSHPKNEALCVCVSHSVTKSQTKRPNIKNKQGGNGPSSYVAQRSYGRCGGRAHGRMNLYLLFSKKWHFQLCSTKEARLLQVIQVHHAVWVNHTVDWPITFPFIKHDCNPPVLNLHGYV